MCQEDTFDFYTQYTNVVVCKTCARLFVSTQNVHMVSIEVHHVQDHSYVCNAPWGHMCQRRSCDNDVYPAGQKSFACRRLNVFASEKTAINHHFRCLFMGHLSFLIFKFYEGYHNICILAYIQVNSSVFGEGSHRTPKVMTQFWTNREKGGRGL